MTTEQFDIFISHNSRDKQLIDPIVQQLYDEYDIRSWLDKWDLHASAEWEPAIRQALESCRICAVVLGANGWGPHHLKEAQFSLERNATNPDFRVIPILLPGADQEAMAAIGDFFQRTHRVDFSNGMADEEAFRRLLAAIRGEAPGPPPLTVFSIKRSARQWEQASIVDKPSILYRGGELRRAQGIAVTHAAMLSNAAVGFLSASAEAEQRNIQTERRRTRKIIAGLVIGLAIVAGTAVFAWAQRAEALTQSARAEQQRQVAEGQRERADEKTKEALAAADAERTARNAEAKQRAIADKKTEEALAAADAEHKARTAEAEQRRVATVQRDTAQSRELASTADAQLSVDPERSVLLAHAALQKTPTKQAELSLRRSLIASHVRAAYRSNMDSAVAAEFGPDGPVALTVHLDHSVAIQNLRTKSQVSIPGYKGQLWRGYFLLKAARLLTFDLDGRTRVWNTKTGNLETELRHSDTIKAIAVAPENSRVATVSDAELVVWQLPTAVEVLRIKRDSNPMTLDRASFSSDGQTLRIVGQDGSVKVSDLTSRTTSRVPCNTASNSIVSFAFDGQGQHLITSVKGGGGAAVCETKSGANVSTLNGSADYFTELRFSHNGKLIASAGSDGAARIWDMSTGRMLRELRGHTYAVSDLIFSSDDRYLVTISEDKSALVWDVETGQLLEELRGHEGNVKSAMFSPYAKNLLTLSDDGTVRIWEVNSIQNNIPLPGHAGNVTAAAYSPDGRLLVTAGGDTSALLWNTETRKLVAALTGHKETVSRISISKDGNLIATTAGSVARVWDNQGNFITEMSQHQWVINSVAINSLGTRIVTAGDIEDTAIVWESRTGRILARLDGSGGGCKPHSGSISDAVFSPNGHLIVTTSFDNTARIWNADSGRCLRELVGHQRSVSSAAFSPNGDRVVTTSFDNTARVWDVASGKPLAILGQHLRAVTTAKFSRDGTLIATASDDGSARVWDSGTYQTLAVIDGPKIAVNSIEFSPDGRFLVIASNDETPRVWEARTGKIAAELTGHRDIVWRASFSPDGKFIATASKDGTARIYGEEMFLPIGEVLSLAETRVTRPLTPAELDTFAPFLVELRSRLRSR